jgi:hypothetical protein
MMAIVNLRNKHHITTISIMPRPLSFRALNATDATELAETLSARFWRRNNKNANRCHVFELSDQMSKIYKDINW